MKDIIDRYKEALPFGVFILYLLGGLYYIIFYKMFGIDIIPYLSLTEVLIKAIIYIALILLKMIAIEFVLFLMVDKVYYWLAKKDLPDDKYFISSFFLQFFLIFAIGFLPDSFILSIYVPYILLLFIKMHIGLKEKDNLQLNSIIGKFILICCIILLLYCFADYAYSDAESIIKGNSQKNIELVLNDKTYSTKENESLKYIGETSTTYFLFDKSKNNTIIIDKSHVIEFILLDSAVKPKLNSFFIGLFD